jgi:hypothetical protein
MAGDSRLRIGGWVLGSRGDRDDESGVSAGAPDDDRPDVREATSEAEVDPDAAGYAGRHRQSAGARPAVRLRAVSIAAVSVGVLLVGTGVAARLLGPGSDSLAPPPSPPEVVVASPHGQLDGLGERRTPTSSQSASPSVQAPETVAQEAEDAELGDHAQVVSLDGASAGQAVRLSGAESGRFVRFTTVAPVSGSYDLTVFYVTEQAKAGALSVNDESPIGFTFEPGGEAEAPGSVTVSVELAAGENTVLVGSSGGTPMFLDRIAIAA